jgi:2-polyprenyl-6-methoxyphenol hydroxylase-like FAD-dependent oxidoreductase
MALAPAVLPESPAYDAIVIGARCAGSPTAMLLARAGYKVLVVDRAIFPSDWMRAHFVRNPGVQCLERWGLLPRVAASGCPAVTRWVVDMGDFPLPMSGHLRDGGSPAYAPRRFVLDQILVEAAIEAGVEVRQGFSVREVLVEEGRVIGIRGRAKGGREVTERARVVIGADGLHSLVARTVQAPTYDAHPAHASCYYSYFGDMTAAELQIAFAADRVVIAVPTNDGLTLVAVAAPIAEFPAFKGDTERAFFASLNRAPWLEEQVRAGRRAERWLGTGDLPNFFRKPYGPGWALVGDAGYHKDPIPARGISDAFRDADLLAAALEAGFSGRAPLEVALAAYERRRNEAARPTFQEAVERAAFLPFPSEVLAQRAAMRAAA